MTTATLPVYDETGSNRVLAGVVGIDVLISDLEDLPVQKEINKEKG